MASIFQRLTNIARANIAPALERQVRRGMDALGSRGAADDENGGGAAGTGTRGATSGSGGMRSGRTGATSGTRGSGTRGSGARRPTSRDSGPIYAGPAEVHTVEVGGRPVTSATRPYDLRRHGLPKLDYAPRSDGRPDPGEVVWTWIPFDDDPSQGKDRPALVLSVEGGHVVLAQLTSRDHASGGASTDQFGRVWYDVGSGAWDKEGRPSEVRLDKLWLVEQADVRREGAALDRARFVDVAQRLHLLHG